MNAYIKALSYYLPERVLTNDRLAELFPDRSAEKVAAKVGINRRHIAADGETAADLAIRAAEKLFAEGEVKPADIDFVLLCTQSPDYRLPTTACLLQHRLGIPTSAGALDYNLGCSGYVYRLALAKGLIVGGIAKKVLLLTAETYSKYIDTADKGNRSLFGDGAAATVVAEEGFAEIGDFSLGTDGSGGDLLQVKTGGARYPEPTGRRETDEGGSLKADDRLYMNGSEIFNFTLAAVPPLLEDVLRKNRVTADEVGQYVFHQANKFMLSTLRKVCGLPKDRFYIDLAETGNTVSSTLPIALHDALDRGLLTAGAPAVIAGFGVGLSWGACVLKF